jgi:hypothetical protein
MSATSLYSADEDKSAFGSIHDSGRIKKFDDKQKVMPARPYSDEIGDAIKMR